jgi:hypothetical protein
MQSFPWKLWIAVAYRLQLRLENWAIGVLPAPGADFKVEDLRVQEWKVLAAPIISGVGKRLNIVRWESGLSFVLIRFLTAKYKPRGTCTQ